MKMKSRIRRPGLMPPPPWSPLRLLLRPPRPWLGVGRVERQLLDQRIDARFHAAVEIAGAEFGQHRVCMITSDSASVTMGSSP